MTDFKPTQMGTAKGIDEYNSTEISQLIRVNHAQSPVHLVNFVALLRYCGTELGCHH